jgi:chromosome segregation ATPase
MRKTIALLLVLAAGLFVYKKTQFGSYAGTLWSQVKQEAKDQVPTKFEIERVRHELGNLDGDISGMIRPIAEYMAAITRLKKDIQKTQTNLDEQKTVLLAMTHDLEGNPTFVEYGGEKYTSERVRGKLHKDFESFKRLESHLHSQKKLLEAKEASLKATQEQLAKVIAKKREYEVRLAQLEADEETLQVAKLGSKLEFDDTRTTQIEAALAEIEHRQNVLRAEVELQTGSLANDFIPVQKGRSGPDVQTIRQYLEGSAVASTAQQD